MSGRRCEVTTDRYAWERAIRDPASGIKGAVLGVLLVMVTHANVRLGMAMWPSVALLARETGHSEGTVKRAKREGRRLGYLVRTSETVGRGRVYRLALPVQGDKGVTTDPRTGVTTDPLTTKGDEVLTEEAVNRKVGRGQPLTEAEQAIRRAYVDRRL